MIVTFDRDFGAHAFRPLADQPLGFVYFRLARMNVEFVTAMLLRLAAGTTERIEGQFTVVDEHRISPAPAAAVQPARIDR